MIRKPSTFETYKIEDLQNFIRERLSWLDDFDAILGADNGENEGIDEVRFQIDNACDTMEAAWGKTGASKCVFWFHEYPYIVFKIPFKGEGTPLYDDDDYTDGFDTSEINWYFEGARLASQHWDYCEQEVEVYNLAKKAHLSQFLAETIKLTTYNGHPIYVSQYAKDVDDIHPCSEESKKTAKKYIAEKKDYNFSSLVLGNFLDQYEATDVYKLLSFFYIFSLGDFHTGNLGYNREGKIIIIDYSDFDS